MAERATGRGQARVGCSGWCYRDWRGPVYPFDLPTKLWFQHYATLFDTVELNNTFYRLPTQKAMQDWEAAAPPNFLYALKLGQFASHRKKLKDPEWWLANHLDRVERLRGHLGPNLVQLPPRWQRNTARLDEFLSLVPKSIRWAVELRDRSWVHDDTFEVLRRHAVALCLHDLIEDHPYVLTTDWTYIRFHGPHATVRPYHDAYGKRRLQPWAERLQHELARGHDVYCYFNNDYHGHAVNDATLLRGMLNEPV